MTGRTGWSPPVSMRHTRSAKFAYSGLSDAQWLQEFFLIIHALCLSGGGDFPLHAQSLDHLLALTTPRSPVPPPGHAAFVLNCRCIASFELQCTCVTPCTWSFLVTSSGGGGSATSPAGFTGTRAPSSRLSERTFSLERPSSAQARRWRAARCFVAACWTLLPLTAIFH